MLRFLHNGHVFALALHKYSVLSVLRIENAWEIVGPGAAAGAGTASGTSNSVSFSSIGSSGAFTSKGKKIQRKSKHFIRLATKFLLKSPFLLAFTHLHLIGSTAQN